MKMNNKKGFTLMEMLIVVAIIAILVAIAIPTFSGSLTKARQGADNANVRAAYAEAIANYLATGTSPTTVTTPAAMQAAYDTKTVIGDVTPTAWAKGDTVTVTVTAEEDGDGYSITIGPSK